MSLAQDLGCARHVIEVRLAVEQDFRIRPLEAQLLHARANQRRRRFEIGVDKDVTGWRGDEKCRQVLAADIVKVIGDLERRQRRRPLWIHFRECGEREKQGEEREEAAHGLFGKADCFKYAANGFENVDVGKNLDALDATASTAGSEE